MDVKSQSEIVIEPGKTSKNYWKDIWRYRELFYILSWRDIKVRYKQTLIGISWAILRPLLTMIIFTVIFGKVAKLENNSNVPYSILVFAGMLPWQFFANSLSEASNSLIGNSNLITKVYFPRIIIPGSAVITSFVDFAISFVLLAALFVWYDFSISVKIFVLPFFLILAFIASFGISLLLTALNVKYRDFRYIIPFIVQFGLYVSPVGFSTSVIPEKWKLIYSLNPMVGVIDGFRWCIIGEEKININVLIVSTLVSIFFLLLGITYFRNTEKQFADNI